MSIHYHKLGNGSHVLLAFHGIGQDGKSCFETFAKNLGEYYTIYAFDLFFHGQSNPVTTLQNGDEVVSKKKWSNLIQQFLTAHQVSRFDVAGFSMGGRFALATLEAFSLQIDKAFLIAPDGISEHPLYTFATRFGPARRLFRWCMQHPELLFKTTHVLHRVKLVNSSLYRFSQHVLNTSEKRATIYNAWVAFRFLRFDVKKLYFACKSNHTELYLFIGKYDKLLKAKDVKRLAGLLPADKYLVLQSGHAQLVEKVSEYCKNHLLSTTGST
jgi:pimeloyl-ACP methyl ester carboxylesterase